MLILSLIIWVTLTIIPGLGYWCNCFCRFWSLNILNYIKGSLWMMPAFLTVFLLWSESKHCSEKEETPQLIFRATHLSLSPLATGRSTEAHLLPIWLISDKTCRYQTFPDQPIAPINHRSCLTDHLLTFFSSNRLNSFPVFPCHIFLVVPKRIYSHWNPPYSWRSSSK